MLLLARRAPHRPLLAAVAPNSLGAGAAWLPNNPPASLAIPLLVAAAFLGA